MILLTLHLTDRISRLEAQLEAAIARAAESERAQRAAELALQEMAARAERHRIGTRATPSSSPPLPISVDQVVFPLLTYSHAIPTIPTISFETDATRDRGTTIHGSSLQERHVVPDRESSWIRPIWRSARGSVCRARPSVEQQPIRHEGVLQLRAQHHSSSERIPQRVRRARQASEPPQHHSVLV